MQKTIYLGGSSPFWATVDTCTKMVQVGGGYEPQWISIKAAQRIEERNAEKRARLLVSLQAAVDAGNYDLSGPGEFAWSSLSKQNM